MQELSDFAVPYGITRDLSSVSYAITSFLEADWGVIRKVNISQPT